MALADRALLAAWAFGFRPVGVLPALRAGDRAGLCRPARCRNRNRRPVGARTRHHRRYDPVCGLRHGRGAAQPARAGSGLVGPHNRVRLLPPVCGVDRRLRLRLLLEGAGRTGIHPQAVRRRDQRDGRRSRARGGRCQCGGDCNAGSGRHGFRARPTGSPRRTHLRQPTCLDARRRSAHAQPLRLRRPRAGPKRRTPPELDRSDRGPRRYAAPAG